MKKIDTTLNKVFYKNSFKNHGASAKGVHWSSKESQYLRFEILNSFLKNLENSSIIDIGCGYGEYLNFLQEKNLKPKTYLGLDCEDFFINFCKNKFPKYNFLECDILKSPVPTADYIFCSGAFNLLEEKTFLNAIELCFNSSKKGFVFNFLTKNTIHKLKKEMVIDFSKKLTKKISISKDYLDNDLSLFLEK